MTQSLLYCSSEFENTFDNLSNGKFILEIGFDQKNKVINLLRKEGFYINCTKKDLAQNDRCIVCTKL